MRVGVREVVVERLTEEAFRPFGGVIALPEREWGKPRLDMEPDRVRIPHADLWSLFDLDFSGRPPYVGWVRYYRREFRFHTLESHLDQTEVLIPYGGAPSVFAVAPATPLDDPDTIPDPESVRAFLLDGTKGIAFHRGVWHRHVYPLGDWTDLIAILPSDYARSGADEAHRGKTATRHLDFEKSHGVTLALVIRGWDASPDILGEVTT